MREGMMRRRIFEANASVFILFAIILIFSGQCGAQAEAESPYKRAQQLPWRTYPDVLNIQDIAVLNFDTGHKFLNPEATTNFLKISGNLPAEGNYTVVDKDLSWWPLFSYEATGHVNDTEELDSELILRDLKNNNVNSNTERKKAGIPELTLEGWTVVPHYDSVTHNLEWGTRLTSEGTGTVNYTVRLLGREGLVSAMLVSDPVQFDKDLTAFRSVLRGFVSIV